MKKEKTSRRLLTFLLAVVLLTETAFGSQASAAQQGNASIEEQEPQGMWEEETTEQAAKSEMAAEELPEECENENTESEYIQSTEEPQSTDNFDEVQGSDEAEEPQSADDLKELQSTEEMQSADNSDEAQSTSNSDEAQSTDNLEETQGTDNSEELQSTANLDELQSTDTQEKTVQECDKNTFNETQLQIQEIAKSMEHTDKSLAASDYIAGGLVNEVRWLLDKNGKLTVEGRGEFERGGTPWYPYHDKILTAEIILTDVEDISELFEDCENLTSVDLSGLDTSKAVSMDHMFWNCPSLEEVDLSGFDTRNVQYMYGMFYGCEGLKKLDLSSFDTSEVIAMEEMFLACVNLEELNISSFRTPKLQRVSYMFTSCRALKSLDLSKMDFSNVVVSKIYDHTDQMLWNTDALTQIRTPRKLTPSIKLFSPQVSKGRYAWVNASGKELKELPKEKNDSITLTRKFQKGAPPEESSEPESSRVPESSKVPESSEVPKSSEEESEEWHYPSDKVTLIDLEEAGGRIASNIKPKTYDGTPYTPAVKVTVKNEAGKTITLTEGVDYRVSYRNNVDAGTARVIVKGNGIYTGKLEQKFEIRKKSMKSLKVFANAVQKGKIEEPVIRIYDGVREIKKHYDFEVEADPLIMETAGTKKVSIKAAEGGNYTGQITTDVIVYDADGEAVKGTINDYSIIIVSRGGMEYQGKPLEPEIAMWAKDSDKLNLTSEYYKVTYHNNKKPGLASVTVTGCNGYVGTMTRAFQIFSADPDNNSFALKKEIKAVTYNGKLQKPKPVVTVGKKTLKAGRDYLVSYSNNFRASEHATLTITGIGEYAKFPKKTVSFEIKKQQIKKASVKIKKDVLTLTYAGHTLVEGVDYSLSYGEPDTKKNKVSVVIEGKGSFSGKMTKVMKFSAKR